MVLNSEDFEHARQIRDARFDGRFFIGVVTTGIYCRPICPVRIPKKENIQLYQSAAAAAAAGFRPCLRCRPESSPGTPAWSGTSYKVSRALQLIEQGFLDNSSIDELATQLNIGSRQLGRLFQQHLGASPIEVAQTRRLHFAKKLIDETSLPFAKICFAAGYGSVRRFNHVFHKTYKRSPKEIRKKQNKNIVEYDSSVQNNLKHSNSIEMSLSYRPPFNWGLMLDFFALRAINGVEVVTENSYARTIVIDGLVGDLSVVFFEASNQLKIKINFPNTKYLYHIVEKIRSMFDLRADSAQIEKSLSSDAFLAPIVKAFSGVRVPGCWDGFEIAVRAILGQQVSVKAASTLAARIVECYGEVYECTHSGLTRIFPSPSILAAADFKGMGIVKQRISAIRQVSKQIVDGELHIDCSIETEDFEKKICSIKGIGPWTAQYIELRALHDPNAFPAADLILRRAVAPSEKAITANQLLTRSEAWQPWRAYTVILLWNYYQSINSSVD